MVNHFCKRIVKENLLTLLKGSNRSDNDQIALPVHEVLGNLKEITPRKYWLVGFVVTKYLGRDGQLQ